MSGANTSNYRIVSWADVQKHKLGAYERFRDHMCKMWLKDDRLRLVFSLIVTVKRKHPTPEQVMELFTVRAKHNWKWIGARASDELLCLIVASGLQGLLSVQYTVNSHRSWWS